MVNSCPSTDTDRPSHQLEYGTRQHCLSTTPHNLSYHMSDHQCLGLSLCPVLTARLTAITASSLCCPGQVSRVASPHCLNPHCREPSIITDRCRVSRLHQTTGTQSDPRVSRYPAEIGFDSLNSYAIAPPSAQSEVTHQTPTPPST